MRISDWSSDVCSSDLIDRHGLDQDVLVAVELVELAREFVQTPRQRRFALISAIRRQERGQGGCYQRGLGDAAMRGQIVQPPGVAGLDRKSTRLNSSH